MKALIKKLIQRRKEELTFLLLDDENLHRQETFTINPSRFFLWVGALNLGIILLLLVLLFFTPAGSRFFSREDRAIRTSVVEIRGKVMALQDSLRVRDAQLTEIQRVLRTGQDTVFDVGSTRERAQSYLMSSLPAGTMNTFTAGYTGTQALHRDQIIYSDLFTASIHFPAEPPVLGSLTGSYQPERNHFGIDIAAATGTDVFSIADGVVISSDWTINNGFVIHILHAEGYLSVYKHFSQVFFKAGDFVRHGDVIGKVGETGVLATGPHIHFELWKNGTALDPLQYLAF